jgi:preprotein translocase subunit SecD
MADSDKPPLFTPSMAGVAALAAVLCAALVFVTSRPTFTPAATKAHPAAAVSVTRVLGKGLEFKIMPAKVSLRADGARAACASNLKDSVACDYENSGAYEASGAVVYSGRGIKAAQASYDQSGRPIVQFQTKDPQTFGTLTGKNMGRILGIFFDRKFLSAATIQGVIASDGVISGNFTHDDMVKLADEINAQARP